MYNTNDRFRFNFEDLALMAQFNNRCNANGIHNFVEDYKNHIIPEDVDAGPLNMWSEKYYSRDFRGISEYAIRDITIRLSGFTLVTKAWVKPLVEEIKRFTHKESPCILEVMAGTGCLSKAMADEGCKVLACDIMRDKANFNGYNKPWYPVEQKDMTEMLREHYKEVNIIVMSWPRPEVEIEIFLKTWYDLCRDIPMIYIGEGWGGCCAEEEFWKYTEELRERDFDTSIANSKIKHWDGIHDYINCLMVLPMDYDAVEDCRRIRKEREEYHKKLFSKA